MKTIILLDSINESVLEKFRNCTLIALNPDAEHSLEKKGLPFKNILDYGVVVEINHKLVSDIRSWWHQGGNKNIFSSFACEGLNLSWILEDWLFGTTPYCDSIIDILEFVKLLNEVLKIEKPDKIILISDDPNKKILFEQLSINKEMRGNFKKIKHKRDSLFFASKTRNLLKGMVSRMPCAEAAKKYKILCMASKTVYYKSGSRIRFGNVAEAIHEKIGNKNDYEFKIISWFGSKSVSSIPIEAYISRDLISLVNKTQKIIYKKWKAEKNYFRNAFKYGGFNLYGILEDNLEFFFSRFINRVLLEIYLVKKIIEMEKPDLMIHDDFATPKGRILMTIAKNSGAKNLAIQHGGAMVPWITSIFDKRELAAMPDKFAAHGFKNKEFLVKLSKLKPNSIKIVGDPQYDILKEIISKFDKKEIMNDLGMQNGKNTVLFAPSMDISKNEKAVYAKMVRNIAENESMDITVKFHPRENDEKIYKTILKGTVFLNGEISKLIHESDIVVSTLSSVNFEAVLLGKPSIILDPFGCKKAWSEWFDVIKKESELSNMLKARRFKKISRRFIKDFYYKLDGKSCERIGNIITKMVEK